MKLGTVTRLGLIGLMGLTLGTRAVLADGDGYDRQFSQRGAIVAEYLRQDLQVPAETNLFVDDTQTAREGMQTLGEKTFTLGSDEEGWKATYAVIPTNQLPPAVVQSLTPEVRAQYDLLMKNPARYAGKHFLQGDALVITYVEENDQGTWNNPVTYYDLGTRWQPDAFRTYCIDGKMKPEDVQKLNMPVVEFGTPDAIFIKTGTGLEAVALEDAPYDYDSLVASGYEYIAAAAKQVNDYAEQFEEQVYARQQLSDQKASLELQLQQLNK